MTHELTLSEIHRHHDHLISEIRDGYRRLLKTAASGESTATLQQEYVAFLEGELLPHAMTEEETIYADGLKEAELNALVDGMKDEHQRIVALIAELKSAEGPLATVAAAAGFITMLEAHFDKENRLLLPALHARGLLPD